MRAQVMIVGPVERELSLRLDEELPSHGVRRAHDIGFRLAGSSPEIAKRLAKLGLSAGVVAAIGREGPDKEILATLRRWGVQTRGIQQGDSPTTLTVGIRTPRSTLRLEPDRLHAPLELARAKRALAGSRHVHFEAPANLEAADASEIAAHARSVGATTSCALERWPEIRVAEVLQNLLAPFDIVFAPADVFRSLAEERSLGSAVAVVREIGPVAAAASLGAGGWRVYDDGGATRIPILFEDVAPSREAFVSGYLLGWLLGSPSSVCGVLGAAAAGPSSDRRRLASNLERAQRLPAFRRLVPAMAEARRILRRRGRLPRRELAPRRLPL